MNSYIINDCARTEHDLPTAGTDPGRRYFPTEMIEWLGINVLSH